MAEEATEQDFNWLVQLGPDIQSIGGVVNGTSATFYLSVPGITGQVFASCSTDAGHSWTPIPANTVFPVSGDNAVQWQVEALQDSSAKFLIGNIG